MGRPSAYLLSFFACMMASYATLTAHSLGICSIFFIVGIFMISLWYKARKEKSS